MIDHNEMNAIASLYAQAKNIIPSEEFKAGFSAGFHLGEILYEERLYGDKPAQAPKDKCLEIDKSEAIKRLEKRLDYLRGTMYAPKTETDDGND